MRNKKSITLIMAMVLPLLGACTHSRSAAAPSDQASEYRDNVAAKPGMARVYVLPTFSKGLYSDLNGQATISLYPDGSNRGVRLASTSNTMFVGFDLGPGTYDLVATGEVGIEQVSKSLVASPNTVYFLRPTFYRSAKDMPKNPAETQPGLGFDGVDPEVGRAEIQHLHMAVLSRQGQAYLAKTMGGVALSAPPVVAPPVMPQSPPTFVAPTFVTVEQKLKDLQKLKNEGLITQQDYDERRRAVLNAY